jgi:hypothetical protein
VQQVTATFYVAKVCRLEEEKTGNVISYVTEKFWNVTYRRADTSRPVSFNVSA